MRWDMKPQMKLRCLGVGAPRVMIVFWYFRSNVIETDPVQAEAVTNHLNLSPGCAQSLRDGAQIQNLQL